MNKLKSGSQTVLVPWLGISNITLYGSKKILSKLQVDSPKYKSITWHSHTQASTGKTNDIEVMWLLHNPNKVVPFSIARFISVHRTESYSCKPLHSVSRF